VDQGPNQTLRLTGFFCFRADRFRRFEIGLLALFLFLEQSLAQIDQKLTELLTPAVEALGFEMVGVEFVRAGKHSTLRLYIDHESGITVENCAEVSHQAGAILDVEDPISTEYNLEVSSPGMDRPLFKEEHYQRFIGENVSVRLRIPQNNRRGFKGKLLACEDGQISIEVDGQRYELAIINIDKGQLVPSFD
jgi:ribosome maturation factor RimP